LRVRQVRRGQPEQLGLPERQARFPAQLAPLARRDYLVLPDLRVLLAQLALREQLERVGRRGRQALQAQQARTALSRGRPAPQGRKVIMAPQGLLGRILQFPAPPGQPAQME
jgi:hypothetical protein